MQINLGKYLKVREIDTKKLFYGAFDIVIAP